jgi:hypothetical protein
MANLIVSPAALLRLPGVADNTAMQNRYRFSKHRLSPAAAFDVLEMVSAGVISTR